MAALSFTDLYPDAAPATCNGCGVCMLSCPVWMQQRTPSLTSCCRTMAVQNGALDEELAISARACILCGSCEALCPRDLRTLQMTIRLRSRLHASSHRPRSHARTVSPRPSGAVLLAGRALRAAPDLLNAVSSLLVHRNSRPDIRDDDGSDIVAALEAGSVLPEGRLERFVSGLAGEAEIIITDGILFSLLLPLFGEEPRFRSLGEALLGIPQVHAGLRPSDLYVIEARAYNLRWKQLAARYDGVRRETGCLMNLDLQRVATPTGALGLAERNSPTPLVSPEKQVAWLLEGRHAERVVVEHPDDRAAFMRHSRLPVVHLAEVVRS